MSRANVYIPDNMYFAKWGIGDFEQAKFAKHNLLIGKNGSGKTRFLKALEEAKASSPRPDEDVITLYFPEIQAFYHSVDLLPSEETEQDVYAYDILFDNDHLSFRDFLKIVEKDGGEFLELVLSHLEWKGRRSKLGKAAAAGLEKLNDRLFQILDRKIIVDRDQQTISILKSLEDGSERRLEYREALSEFSPGELMLFYLCLFLFFISNQPQRSITIIMDEPEQHLHPRALVKVMKALKNAKQISELWVASHSLYLVPIFDFEEIVLLENSRVLGRNSRTYQEVCNELLGLENINIFDFLKSLRNWEYYQFIVECFCLPEVVGKANHKDEQFVKLLGAFEKIQRQRPLKVLDYGAGQFRIWDCLQLIKKESSDLEHKIIYEAYEPYPANTKKPPFQLYTSLSELEKRKGKYDAVILMNVLHEIDVREWLKTLKGIAGLLTENGVLIFLEVKALSHGEQPYGDSGFLVLQDKQVKELFQLDQTKDAVPVGKSNCWIIRPEQLTQINQVSLNACLDSLKNECFEVLRKLFHKRIEQAHEKITKEEFDITARKYAFYSQQYLNAILAKELLCDTKLEEKGATPRTKIPVYSIKTNDA